MYEDTLLNIGHEGQLGKSYPQLCQITKQITLPDIVLWGQE